MDELIRRLRARDTEAEVDIAGAPGGQSGGARRPPGVRLPVRNDDLDTAAAEIARIVDVVTRSD